MEMKKLIDDLEVGNGMAKMLLSIALCALEDLTESEVRTKYGTRGLESVRQYGLELSK